MINIEQRHRDMECEKMGLLKKKLPIGIDDFEKLRKNDFYYIDKTGLIKDLLDNWGEVTYFTRPRRFGKSLNMSMLQSFFSVNSDPSVFNGLNIMNEEALCEKFMGQYPVIFISLKGINGQTYETAFKMAIRVVNEAASGMEYLLESTRLSENDKNSFRELLRRDMDETALFGSLRELSRLLEKHYEKNTIILIDEYDVPLAKAFENGYYEQMTFLIRNLFEQALKSNRSLKFAVLTGCMRISKESIFTGLNNPKIRSVADVEFDEYFGFTDVEVRNLLQYYELMDHYDIVKEWYDGYRFGNIDVYCPWDVLNYCDTLRSNPDASPQNYWINTSNNDAVRVFIEQSDNGTTKREIERLVAGEKIKKEIRPELTYKDMYSSIDNLWSVLFTTGYLTQRGRQEGNEISLVIPNVEIRNIFTSQIMDFFKEQVKGDGHTLNRFCDALERGDAGKVEQCFNEYLKKTISIRDTFVKRPMKENFYHGILLGILGVKDKWGISSNRETGDGYSDIVVETENSAAGIILEIKYAHDGNLEESCKKALEQIVNTHYEEELKNEGIDRILKYGIACYKKRCKVQLLPSDPEK